MFRGDRLKQLRESRNYTHAELADLINVGFAQIYRFEAQKASPTADILAKLAEVFNVSADYLLGLTDEQAPHFRVDNLSPEEREVLAELRRGNKLAAIRAIAGDK